MVGIFIGQMWDKSIEIRNSKEHFLDVLCSAFRYVHSRFFSFEGSDNNNEQTAKNWINIALVL